MTPEALELRLRHLAFPTQRGRTAAIRHLVLQAPAPVVARMLGYHDDTTVQLAAEAGGTWRHYASATTHADFTSTCAASVSRVPSWRVGRRT